MCLTPSFSSHITPKAVFPNYTCRYFYAFWHSGFETHHTVDHNKLVNVPVTGWLVYIVTALIVYFWYVNIVFKSGSHNGMSILFSCKSAHSSKQCFVAEHLRERRATCDLLSFEIKGFKLNDSACAAHCLTKWQQGYRGGRCENGICVCRK